MQDLYLLNTTLVNKQYDSGAINDMTMTRNIWTIVNNTDFRTIFVNIFILENVILKYFELILWSSSRACCRTNYSKFQYILY